MTGIKENVVVQILKYWPVKYLIVALLALLVYSGFYHFYRCHLGLNSKFLWGAGECLECKDTIITASSATKQDTIYLQKINYIQQKNIAKPKDAFVKNKSTVSGTSNHVVTGDNNKIGVNGDVNFSPRARHSDQELVSIVSKLNPNKLPIQIEYFINDVESTNFYGELYDDLMKAGFAMSSVGHVPMGKIEPSKDNDIGYFVRNDTFFIKIFPQGIK